MTNDIDDRPADLASAILAAVANYRTDEDRTRLAANPNLTTYPAVLVPMMAIVDGMERAAKEDRDSSTSDVFDAVAELVEQGLLEEWESERNAGISLSALSASRLGLKLNPDSTRWVHRGRPEEPKVVASGTLTNTDLTHEGETPLEAFTEHHARLRVRLSDPPIGPSFPSEAEQRRTEEKAAILRAHAAGRALTAYEESVMRRIMPVETKRAWATAKDLSVLREEVEFYKQAALRKAGKLDGASLLGVFAEAIGFFDWSMGEDFADSEVVLLGVHPWPQPGQHRTPSGPVVVVTEWEVERGKPEKPWIRDGKHVCWTCKDLPLEVSTTCDVCDRGGRDYLMRHDQLRANAASKAVHADYDADEDRTKTAAIAAHESHAKGGKRRRKAARKARTAK